MDATRALGGRLAAGVAGLAAAVPVLARGQPALQDPVPPGGAASAWPLGIIVALVGLVFLVGAWLAHGRAGRGGPTR
jgi:hypothetical protein